MGNDVGGIDSAEGNFGISVGVSGDGHVFAEGAHMAIGKDATTGHVRVELYGQRKTVVCILTIMMIVWAVELFLCRLTPHLIYNF